MMSISLQFSDFALELLHCVFRFCSPSDLDSLSRVNNTFRHAAEHLLYRHIHISVALFSDRTWRSLAKKSLFYTLTSNPQKAALLRHLHVQLEFDGHHHDVAKKTNKLFLERRVIDALRNTQGLVDLRIMVYKPADVFDGRLSEVIKGGYFQLHTLYCDSYQDLEGIIVSQKNLRLLGICTDRNRGYRSVLKLIKSRYSNRNFPGIFMLSRSGIFHNISQLTLFPELCLPGQTFTLCRDIASSICRNLVVPVPVDCVLAIHVFDFSYAKTAIICEVIEAMAQRFIDCQAFSMRVQTSDGKGTGSKPWRIPGISTSISRFKQLQHLDFHVSSYDPLRQVADDLRSFLFEEDFVRSGLTLVRVWVNDQSLAVLRASDSDWDTVIIDRID